MRRYLIVWMSMRGKWHVEDNHSAASALTWMREIEAADFHVIDQRHGYTVRAETLREEVARGV
jgi:hypothetical protein